MRGFLLWTRVAWWALLVGVVELVQWLGGSRHGRATAAATLLAALGGGAALLHPALVSTTRAPAQIIMADPTPLSRPAPAPAGPQCAAPLVPVLIDDSTGQQISIVYPLPSTRPPARVLPPVVCPLQVLPIPLAHAELRTSDLVYRAIERSATFSPPAQQ